MSTQPLYMWVVYDHPSDHPDAYVARKWAVTNGVTVATNDAIASTSLDELRGVLAGTGLYRIPRFAADDAAIVETWL